MYLWNPASRHVCVPTQHKPPQETWQSVQMFPGVQIEQLLNMTAASTTDGSSTCEQFSVTWPAPRATLWCCQIIQVFHMTREERVRSNRSRAQITSSRSCGWVGRDREMRELLDLLNAPSSLECVSFPPVCPDFVYSFFYWHAHRNVVEAQVTVLAGLVWCSVFHWSKFRIHHPLPSHNTHTHSHTRLVYYVQDSCQNSEVRVGDGGDEVILFLC